MEPPGSDAASKNGKVEQPNGTFGAMVCCLLYSCGLSKIFSSAALVHAVYLKNCLYYKALRKTPYEAWTCKQPPFDHLCTVGALVTAHKHGKQPVKADHNIAHGILIGYDSTPRHVCYFDQPTNHEQLSTHHIINEAHYSKTRHPPGPQLLMDMGYDLTPFPTVIITPPPRLQYPLYSLNKPVTPFYSKLIPLPMNEFTSAPAAVVTTLITSDIDHNNIVTVTFSTDPFFHLRHSSYTRP
jgi:hypothetical protein